MMRITSLLNPAEQNEGIEPQKNPRRQKTSADRARTSPKREAKDSNDDNDGTNHPQTLQDEVKFPPYEFSGDAELAREQRRFKFVPRGNLLDHHRHIPYNSDKKLFREKTGRCGFDVVQYKFQLPLELRGRLEDNQKEKWWDVMWDYQNGLVRITSFFKSRGYAKTIPKKMLRVNGLDDVSYNVTGGSIAAQGYWVPFEAAKAVAATFCYEIRHALTPIFGKDFLDLCRHPGDMRYEDFRIDPSIVTHCIEQAKQWQECGRQDTPASKQLCPSKRSSPSDSSEPSLKMLRPRKLPRLPLVMPESAQRRVLVEDEHLFSPAAEIAFSAYSVERSRSASLQLSRIARESHYDEREVEAARGLVKLAQALW